MDIKIIGFLLLCSSALLVFYSYDDLIQEFMSPQIKLQKTIEKRTEKTLKKQLQTFSKQASSKDNKKNDLTAAHHIEVKFRSEKALEVLKNYQPKFPTNKKSNIWIEVEILDLPDKENPGFITQISVFDLKTNNKIGEFGETYYFKDYQKK